MRILTRALAILLILLLSACALPLGESFPNLAQSNKPTPKDTVVALSKQIKALCNQTQKDALNAWSQTYDKLVDEFNEALLLTSAANKPMAEYNKIIALPAAQKNRLDLYQGRITWAVYNRKRKEISDGIAAESRRSVQQKF